MPGRIVSIRAQPGQDVQADDELLVMEAMKMELVLRAPRAERSPTCAPLRRFVDADSILVTLEPETAS